MKLWVALLKTFLEYVLKNVLMVLMVIFLLDLVFDTALMTGSPIH